MNNRIIRLTLSLAAASALMTVLVTNTSQDSPQRLLEMAGGVLPQGLIQGITYFLFFFGLSEVLQEMHTLSKERKTLHMVLLSRLGENLPISDALSLAGAEIEVLETQMSSRMAFIRYVCWAIPSVGFIGTVIGISAALGHAGQAATPEGLDYITRMLCVAFDTTLVGLVLVITLSLLQHLTEKLQDELTANLGAYLNAHIIGRIPGAGTKQQVYPAENTPPQGTSSTSSAGHMRRLRTAVIILLAAVVFLCIMLISRTGDEGLSPLPSSSLPEVADSLEVDTVTVSPPAEELQDTIKEMDTPAQLSVENTMPMPAGTDTSDEKEEASAKDTTGICMEITDVLFANVGAKGKILSGYGKPLRASEVCYLKPQLLYRGTVSEKMSVELRCRLITPEGHTIRGQKSPEGFTSSGRYVIFPGEGRKLSLQGWGSRFSGGYSPGRYRYEIWCGEEMVFAREVWME